MSIKALFQVNDMYFSDEITLVTETKTQNALKQFVTSKTKKTVYCDLQSVSSTEEYNAGQGGHKSSGRAIVHTEDYSGQTLVEVVDGNEIMSAGPYDVYRRFLNGDTIELYLEERVGISNAK